MVEIVSDGKHVFVISDKGRFFLQEYKRPLSDISNTSLPSLTIPTINPAPASFLIYSLNLLCGRFALLSSCA
jgi:hypothetical protein